MNHQGTTIIETERLILRPFRLGRAEAQAMYENWASDTRVTQYLTWQPHADVSVTEAIIKSWVDRYDDPTYYQWAVCLRDSPDVPIGSFSIFFVVEELAQGEIGYCIGYDHWGKGYMTELLDAVLDFGFLTVGFHRLEAYHNPANPASGRVMTKSGMRYEGISRGGGKDNQGNFVDLKVYSKLATD